MLHYFRPVVQLSSVFYLSFFLSVTSLCWATDDKLVIFSSHWEGIEEEFTRGFKTWYQAQTERQVVLEWLDQGGTGSDTWFIEAEFRRLPEGINIDLLFGGGTNIYIKLAGKGLLEVLSQTRTKP